MGKDSDTYRENFRRGQLDQTEGKPNRGWDVFRSKDSNDGYYGGRHNVRMTVAREKSKERKG